jgi:MFS family permease
MVFRKGELKALWPFYLDILVLGLSSMITPFVALYYLKLGFSFFQISVLTSAYSVSMVIFEIPTGAIADGFSRKYSVIIGSFILASSFLIVPLTINFYTLILLWVLAGMGNTFISGALEAWVIENLRKDQRMDLQDEYFKKSMSLGSLGTVIAPIIAAVLVGLYSIKILWFIYALGFFISGMLLLLFTKENHVRKKVKTIDVLKKTYHNSKMGIVFSTRNKTFFYITIATIFVELMFMGGAGMNPFLVTLGMHEYQLGYLTSFITGIGIITPFLSKYFKRSKPTNVMSIVVLIAILLHLLLLMIHPPFFIGACCIMVVISVIFDMTSPTLRTFVHKSIPGKIRATVMSVRSMAFQLVIAGSSLVAGILLDLFGPKNVLAYTGLFGIIAIFFYQKVNKL